MDGPGNSSYWSAPTLPRILAADTVEAADLRLTLDCWRRLKGSRKMPARAEISPRDFKHALRTVHIYDVLDAGADFRFRLVGSGVFPGLQQDQTGRLLSEHPDPGVQLRFAAALKRVVETGEPVRSLSLRQTGNLLNDAYTEGLWLPLGDADEVIHVLAHSSLHAVKPGSASFGTKPSDAAPPAA